VPVVDGNINGLEMIVDKTELVQQVAYLFKISGYIVDTSVEVNFREIDVIATERHGLIRKTVLVECADYSGTVGIAKLQEDVGKLEAAQKHLGHQAIIMHVSVCGYTQNASGYALENKIPIFKLGDLKNHLIDFSEYVEMINHDPQRTVILKEYQETSIHVEGKPEAKSKALAFVKNWLGTEGKWLTILGDYGVGKSWLLKRLLYDLIDEYKIDPANKPLPFFIPLQKFSKAFDFQTLIIKTLDSYRITGITYDSFKYLASSGSIVFLLDSFDEMAQTLSRNVLRENLRELLNCVSSNSKAIMTSRPTYFESRSERILLIEREGEFSWHPIDKETFKHQTAIARDIENKFSETQFCRLNDLTPEQRKKLFRAVLAENSHAYSILTRLFEDFQELESISQRAVIARYLTTVAETLALSGDSVRQMEGLSLLPEKGGQLNQARIFEIVIYNLLYRDVNIGELKAEHRLLFLRTFALYLQDPNNSFFASPDAIKGIVEQIFKPQLSLSDSYQQVLENYYRTCRRHSGLTTEKQFMDTSGYIDMPVHDEDYDSNVGFSHNSLREFLVADALQDFIINDKEYAHILNISLTETVCDFVYGISEYKPELLDSLKCKYLNSNTSRVKELIFKIIVNFMSKNPACVSLLGEPPCIESMDLSYLDFSSLPLAHSSILNCVAYETDFRKSDLRESDFNKTIIEGALLDNATIAKADFSKSELVSIFVYDEFSTKTSSYLDNKMARQWLFTRGALVGRVDDLNSLLGKPWYQAAQEVVKTIEHKIAGTLHDSSLYNGTKIDQREFARDFVEFLKKKGVLKVVCKSKLGHGDVVKLNPKFRTIISDFSTHGIVHDVFRPFFEKYTQKSGA
jgi:GTPase SAR1 family protein